MNKFYILAMSLMVAAGATAAPHLATKAFNFQNADLKPLNITPEQVMRLATDKDYKPAVNASRADVPSLASPLVQNFMEPNSATTETMYGIAMYSEPCYKDEAWGVNLSGFLGYWYVEDAQDYIYGRWVDDAYGDGTLEPGLAIEPVKLASEKGDDGYTYELEFCWYDQTDDMLIGSTFTFVYKDHALKSTEYKELTLKDSTGKEITFYDAKIVPAMVVWVYDASGSYVKGYYNHCGKDYTTNVPNALIEADAFAMDSTNNWYELENSPYTLPIYAEENADGYLLSYLNGTEENYCVQLTIDKAAKFAYFDNQLASIYFTNDGQQLDYYVQNVDFDSSNPVLGSYVEVEKISDDFQSFEWGPWGVCYNGSLGWDFHPYVSSYGKLTLGYKAGIDTVLGAVEDVEAPVEYFNLQGMRVATPENGIFIRRQGSKAVKVAL